MHIGDKYQCSRLGLSTKVGEKHDFFRFGGNETLRSQAMVSFLAKRLLIHRFVNKLYKTISVKSKLSHPMLKVN